MSAAALCMQACVGKHSVPHALKRVLFQVHTCSRCVPTASTNMEASGVVAVAAATVLDMLMRGTAMGSLLMAVTLWWSWVASTLCLL